MIFPLPPVPHALLRLCFVLALALPGQMVAAQKVFYRVGSPKAPLQTAHQVDSVVQALTQRFSKSGLTLTSREIRTVTGPDTIIHEVVLSAANAAVMANRAKLAAFVGKPLPAFTLPDLAGQPVNSQSLLGHPVVINMWFAACAPCVAEMPALNKIQTEQAGSNVVFLALTYEESSKVRFFLRRHRFNFRHLPNARAYCEQFTTSYPVSLFVDRKGIVRRIEEGMAPVTGQPGEVNENQFRAALESITQP